MATDNSSNIVFDSKSLQALRLAEAETAAGRSAPKETLRSILIVLLLLAAVAACFFTLGR
jgi:hypothetical protein